MNVRQGTVEDIAEVSGLWLSMVAELSPSSKPNVKWWIDIATRCFQLGTYNMFIAEEGSIVGFVDYFLFPEPSDGKIHQVGQHLYVYPEYRGTKAAEIMYRKALKLGKEQGAEVVELMCFNNEKEMWNKKGYSTIRTMVRRSS